MFTAQGHRTKQNRTRHNTIKVESAYLARQFKLREPPACKTIACIRLLTNSVSKTDCATHLNTELIFTQSGS